MTTINAEILNQGPLTRREAEIAALWAEGYSDKAIAARLDISIRTVNAHSASIAAKLNIHSASISANTAAINNRCWVVSVMIARQLLRVSLSSGVKAVALVLIFNAARFDDESVNRHRIRYKSQSRAHSIQSKRSSDA